MSPGRPPTRPWPEPGNGGAEGGAFDNPGGWVYRVGLNWATSRLRKTRRERSLSPKEAGAAVTGPAPGATVAVNALAELPMGQRAVVVCRVLFQWSTADRRCPRGR